jgi:FixJ family two-component response regulator
MPGNLSIAIVDDDESAREASVDLARALGFSAAGYSRAADFLNSADLSQTACLIADVWMPEMNGLELHQHLVRSGTPVPTILVTSYPDQSVRMRALEAGVASYLEKPLEADRLLACLRKAMRETTSRPTR